MRTPRARSERLALIGLLVAMAISAVVTLILSRHLSFYADELDWLTAFDSLAPRDLLTPHNSHLIAITRLIYEVLPRAFGTSYLPFRIIDLTGVLACAALVFVLVRRRVGGPIALAPAVVFLFFGSSHEIVLTPLGTPVILSVAFGLAALVAIEKATPSGDWTTLALLTASILCETFGVIFAAGIAVQLLLVPERRRSVWIAAVPIALWIAWWLWARQFGQEVTSASNIPATPLYVLESAGSAAMALTGLGPEFGGDVDRFETAVNAVAVLIAVAGISMLALRVRRVGASPYLWSFIALAFLFWFSAALAHGPDRPPTTSRYQFFGAIAIALIAAETLRGSELRRRALAVLLVIFGVSLVGNGLRLGFGAARLSDQGNAVQSQLAMVELAGDSAIPGFSPSLLAPRGSPLVVTRADVLLRFDDEVGPLGFPLPQVREQSEAVRADADFVLARALGLLAAPAEIVDLGSHPSCTTLGSDSTGQIRVPLRPVPQVLNLVEGPVQPLLIGRFADSATVPVGTLDPGADVAVGLPADAAPDRWFAMATGKVRVCV